MRLPARGAFGVSWRQLFTSKADCRAFTRDPPIPVPSKRSFSAFGKGVGGDEERATASTGTNVAMPAVPPVRAVGGAVK